MSADNRLKLWLGYRWCLVVGHNHEGFETTYPEEDARRYSLRCLRCHLIWPSVLVVTETIPASRLYGGNEKFTQDALDAIKARHKRDRKAPPEAYEGMFS